MEIEQPEIQPNNNIRLLYEVIEWIKMAPGGIYRVCRNIEMNKRYLLGVIELNKSTIMAEDLQQVDLCIIKSKNLPMIEINTEEDRKKFEEEKVSVKKIEVYIVLVSHFKLAVSFVFSNSYGMITKEMQYLISYITIKNDMIQVGILELRGRDEEIQIQLNGNIMIRIKDLISKHKMISTQVNMDTIKILNLYMYKKLVIDERRRIDFIFDEIIPITENLKELDQQLKQQMANNRKLIKQGKQNEIRFRIFRFEAIRVQTSEKKSIQIKVLKNFVTVMVQDILSSEEVITKKQTEKRDSKQDKENSCFIEYKDLYMYEGGWSWKNSSNSFMCYKDIIELSDRSMKEQLNIILRGKHFILINGFEVRRNDK